MGKRKLILWVLVLLLLLSVPVEAAGRYRTNYIRIYYVNVWVYNQTIYLGYDWLELVPAGQYMMEILVEVDPLTYPGDWWSVAFLTFDDDTAYAITAYNCCRNVVDYWECDAALEFAQTTLHAGTWQPPGTYRRFVAKVTVWLRRYTEW